MSEFFLFGIILTKIARKVAKNRYSEAGEIRVHGHTSLVSFKKIATLLKLSRSNPFQLIHPHVSSVKDIGNIRVCILRGNQPISGSFSPHKFPASTKKPRKTVIFSSCGEYTQISLCLLKYG
jgi:hypothetical protein